ncbi:MAG: MBL fold metallo-hydrolase [Treponema sp.]|jgi:L-ascorbate metabolism protein UlaG (beta-lactamase superfamily)|nr:MBL fold metallo-hydrolase [Treponema sp.]
MKLKWYGTASILLEKEGTQLLFDPFLSLNGTTFKPSIDDFAAVKNIFVTHGHLDHIIDIPLIAERGGNKATVYCTATPYKVLTSKGVANEQIHKIAPGDVLNIGSFEVRVLKGKHIEFNKGLILKTILNPRVLAYRDNLMFISRENKVCIEAGETVVFDIYSSQEHILLLGSLNLDEHTEYPTGVDLLILPLQGRSDISRYAIPFIDRLLPKKVLLDHFDDTFPPISSAVDTGSFVKLLAEKHPSITVISTRAGNEWINI